jgi:probable HAF family extracellular repeat protein
MEIPTLGGLISAGAAINSSGQVTGYAELPNGSYHAFVYKTGGQTLDLGTLGGGYSYGSAINSSGQVAGYASTINGRDHAFATTNSNTMTDLGMLTGFGASYDSYAWDINDAGQTTGKMNLFGNSHAFITDLNGSLIDLGTLGGRESEGVGINNHGRVTGTSGIAGTSGDRHAFMTDENNQLVDLGTLGGRESSGVAINDAGQVTGSASTANGWEHAFVTDADGNMIDLGTLAANDGYSFGSGINNLGQVVGGYYDYEHNFYRAFVTENNTMIDLGSMLLANPDGWILNSAVGINDSSQITGFGTLNGQARGFILTPTPTPTPTPSDGTGGSTTQGDTIPKAFKFVTKRKVKQNSIVTSNTVKITGINVLTPISVTNGIYSIGCKKKGFTADSGSIKKNQSVCVRHIAAVARKTQTATILDIGGVTSTFTSTTK